MTKSEGDLDSQQVIARATLLLPKVTLWLVILTAVIAGINMVLIYYTVKSNDRAARAFEADKRPLIDVAPIKIMQNLNGTHAITLLSITNFSGFTAYNVAVDLKYGEYSWISEWRKANGGKQSDCGVVKGDWYVSAPEVIIKRLEPGETRTTEGLDKKGMILSGTLNLQKEVVAKRDKGLPVIVRATWENEKGHVFDIVHEYQLIGTTNSANGRSFTFIPKGILAQKDANGKLK
jgi:hypothetical protein